MAASDGATKYTHETHAVFGYVLRALFTGVSVLLSYIYALGIASAICMESITN